LLFKCEYFKKITTIHHHHKHCEINEGAEKCGIFKFKSVGIGILIRQHAYSRLVVVAENEKGSLRTQNQQQNAYKN